MSRGFTCCAVLALLFGASLRVLAAGAAQPDPAYMAKLIEQAHQRGGLYPDFYRINPRLSENQLYAVQKNWVELRRAAGMAIVGFKGGFIPRAPVGGVMFEDGLLASGATVHQRDYQLLIVEAEIAFRFCRDVSAPVTSVAALREAVCELAPALEVADGALPDFAQIKNDFAHLRQTLIPLNVAYKQVLLGSPVSAAAIDIERLPVVMQHGGKHLGERDLKAEIDLWDSVLWVVDHYVLAEGYTIAAGQYIIPGNQTGIHVGAVGTYRADFGALGVVELNVEP